MAATLCPIPTFHIKLFFSPFPCRRTADHFHYPNNPRFHNSISASIKKPRVTRQARRRNTDLCNDIRNFLSVAGLPHDHIPTTNELTQHGRQDLANVVRRRGYKFIRELLGSSNSSNKSFNGQDQKMKNSSYGVDGSLKDTSIYPSLQEKASRFIQNGELDSIDDSDFEFLNQSSPTNKNHKGVNTKTQNAENQAEISHLKFMLHQKELELTRLKQKIEAEKNALSEMQLKAQTEMSKVHKLVSEKDAELNAAEESLSGLKEVEIIYRGDGACVEVAGSFNGWHHRIKMDPQTPSSLITSTGLRIFHLWRTILWLYPGIYEIKFVVDGHWRTDPERELVNRGAIENNVLRV